MEFQKFNLDPQILISLEKAKIQTPTPIQEKAIPYILAKSDIRASAQTGTGKTAAFMLPALHLISQKKNQSKNPRILILTPTRELAMQVANEAQKFSSGLRCKTVCIFGGVPYPEQNRQLKKPYDVLVATPGRLIDHLERERIDLSQIEMLILDEADRMLDMGFVEPVEYIVSLCPSKRQTLLFSATLSKQVIQLSQKHLKNPIEIEIASQTQKHEKIEQQFHAVNNLEHKHKLLKELFELPELKQALIFTATKRSSEELSDQLCDEGHNASFLHGDLRQRQRTRTIQNFKKGKIQILVATDVAARGIDIAGISHVVNFDIPSSPEDYVHRIGRTGRAGAKGTAISYVSKRDMNGLKQIEKFTGQKIPLLETFKKPFDPKRSSRKGPRSRRAKKGTSFSPKGRRFLP